MNILMRADPCLTTRSCRKIGNFQHFFVLCVLSNCRITFFSTAGISAPRLVGDLREKKFFVGKRKVRERKRSKMKYFAFVFVFLAVAAPVFGRVSNVRINKLSAPAPEVDLCPTCVTSDQLFSLFQVSFMDNAINQLLNIILRTFFAG